MLRKFLLLFIFIPVIVYANQSLENDLNRGEVIEVRDYYTRADIWEKREILKIVQKKLSVGENRPFLKDIKLHSQDILEKNLTYTEDKSQFRRIYSVIKK